MKSQKELALDRKLVHTIRALAHSDKPVQLIESLLADTEVHAMQEYANTVSIVRLGFNDHGPVHMRKVTLNAVTMLELLQKAGIQTSAEKEDSGTFDDSLVAVILAAYLHDVGMTISRQDHELHSAYLSYPILDRHLKVIYSDDMSKLVLTRSLAIEGIIGHMAGRVVHSLEAGIILVADGCDMEKGRARIPMAINMEPRVGDIHKYSANSIEGVSLTAGTEKPVRIDVSMSNVVGLFQVEEVLLGKIASSTIKQYIELYANVSDADPRRYL